MRAWVKKTATKLNHSAVFIIIITPKNHAIFFGTSGPITNVKRLKKNNVAFGFNTLVKKPILIAFKALISVLWISLPALTSFALE